MKNNKIISNLLQQNCYVRDVARADDLRSSDVRSKFSSIDEIVTSKGVELKRVVLDYPITPQYVQSFVDSSDYKRDPLQAISNAPKRSNLGDISDIQKLDISSIKGYIAELNAKIDSLSKKPSVSVVDNNSLEDNNNG